jgi:hypothetical protein
MQSFIHQLQMPFDLSEAWVTVDERRLEGPSSVVLDLGVVSADYLAAEQVRFAHLPGVWWIVCREEFVEPSVPAGYRRYQLIPLSALPSPPLLPRPEGWGEFPPASFGRAVCAEGLHFGLGQDMLVGYQPSEPSVPYWFTAVGLVVGQVYRMIVSGMAQGVTVSLFAQGCDASQTAQLSTNGCVTFSAFGGQAKVLVYGQTTIAAVVRVVIESGACA